MKMNGRNSRGFFAAVILMLILLLPGAQSVFAAEVKDSAETGKTTTQQETEQSSQLTPKQLARLKRANTWEKKNGYYYRYDKNGRRLTGLKRVRGKAYLFDSKGRQKVGWQKVGKAYYYFRIKNGRYAYMVKSKTVNGIYLKANGKATVSNSTRMAMLWRCSQIVESHTKPTWSKSEKMAAVWSWFQNNVGYWNVIYHHFAGWGLYYANDTFTKNGGSCEGLGCAWAFLANACGAISCECVASGGHGWAEVDGLVYDPACARYMRNPGDYYACPLSLSGVGGRPRYAGNGIYRERV